MKKSFNKLVSLFAVVAIVFTIASCSDDDTLPMAPSISSPEAQSVEVGSTIQVQFDVTTAGGFTSSTATAVNGTATISSNMNTGDTSGSITVDFTGSAAGAGAITLSVTDASGQSKDVTAVITVAAEITVFTVSSNITGEVTWETGKTYILAGRITVLSDAVLTIEPGAVIKGQAGAGANATALLVARGGKLNAVGTAALPIIFTSIADEITPEDVAAGNLASPNLSEEIAGLWGGVIVLGKAKISASNADKTGDVSEVQIEGIPTSDPNGLYGGSDDADNSGTISYVSIRHGGTNIGNGNEINGLTLGGVGNGTTINNIEIVSNQDDGIEFFGGSVNVTDVVVWNTNDDGIDTDQSWSGTLTNFVVITPNTAGAHAFELDGPEGSYSAGHTIKNGTVLASNGDRAAEDLINTDDNSIVTLENIFITGVKAGQDINRTSAAGVVFTKIELNVASADLQSYVTGTIPAGITAASTASTGVGADLTKFTWTWASKSTAWGSL